MSQVQESAVSGQAPHVASLKSYFAVFGFLLLMTWTTVVVAFYDLGQFSTPAALAIATAKATAVILYFMHLRDSTKLTKAVVVGSFLWLGVLFVLTLADYVSRAWPMT